MGNISVYEGKKGRRYHALVRVDGVRKHKTFRKRGDARDWIQRTELEIREGVVSNDKIRVGDVIAAYLRGGLEGKSDSYKSHQTSRLRWWNQRLGQYKAHVLTPTLVRRAWGELELSQSTRSKYMRSLKRAFSWSHAEGVIPRDPMARIQNVPETGGRDRVLTEDERLSLIKAASESHDERMEIIVRLGYGTGGRQSEIMGIRRKDVDLERRLLSFINTKNGDSRGVGIPKHALGLLTIFCEGLGPDEFVLDRNGFHHFPRKAWLKALKAAQIDDLVFHDLRHTCASWLAMSGASLREIADILGHRQLQMVARYSHLTVSHSSTVLDRMNDAIGD